MRKCKSELVFRTRVIFSGHVTKCYPVLLKSKNSSPSLPRFPAQSGAVPGAASRPIRSAGVIRTRDPPKLKPKTERVLTRGSRAMLTSPREAVRLPGPPAANEPCAAHTQGAPSTSIVNYTAGCAISMSQVHAPQSLF